jgi:uncharacterized SAM-binding protein YcdF (DUF218 family)
LNDLLLNLGLEGWKPALTALLLPPVPWLLMVLAGAGLLTRRRAAGWSLLLAGVLLVYLSSCWGVARALHDTLLHPPAALRAEEIDALVHTPANAHTAVVVLGGGVEPSAPEYGQATLTALSVERLRYGVWLGRRTGWPLAFSGGAGHAQPGAPAEAAVAARIASQELGRPLRWTETASRDTRENALRTVPLLHAAGVRRIVLVTHSDHLPRALANFRRAGGDSVQVLGAAVGPGNESMPPLLRWLPSNDGLQLTRRVLREWVGGLTGA